MSFEAPLLLLGLLLLPAGAAAYVAARRRRRRYAVRFPAYATLAGVVPRAPAWRRHLPAALFGLALASLVVALARPERTVAVAVESASVMLVTDVSRSMEATDVAPSRLEAAQAAAGRFLDQVPDGLRVGLVAFSDSPLAIESPTEDHDRVRDALESLSPLSGTATGAALQAALDGVRPEDEEGAEKPPAAIVLLSDGTATDGDVQFDVARDAEREGVPIYTVALGTPDGTVTFPDGTVVAVPPDPDALRRIADESSGQSFQAGDADELSAVYQRLGSQIGTRSEQRQITHAFAAAALLLLAGALGGLARWGGRVP
ncbi:MAG TPA: VWA domain-containing protein [Thermoleophilaceae bacterium]|nr:VWA domain-containing protein [Thermoleophilaceae bacterium]